MNMKKCLGLLLGVLLLAGCSGGPKAAIVPVSESAAMASSAGTDLRWTQSTSAMVLADEAAVEYREPEEEVVVEAVIEPIHWSALGFETGGEVVEVLVEEGNSVQAGDLLVRLNPTEAQLAVEQAEAGLEIAQAQLALLQAGPRPGEVAAAEAQLEAAQATLEQAAAQRDQLMTGATEAEIAAAEAQVVSAMAEQKIAYNVHEDTMTCFTYIYIGLAGRRWGYRICPALGPLEEQARYRLHAADGALAAAQAQLDQVLAGASTNQIRAGQASVLSTAAQRDAVQAQLDLVQTGATAEEIAVAQAGVAEAKAAVESAQATLAHTEVRAPTAGTVTTVNVEVGNIVGPGQAACVLAALDQFQARTTDLTELDVRQVVEGRPATVTVDALEGQRFAGVARQIALQAEDFRGQVVYAVTVELTNAADAPLRWGMTAWVEFGAP